VNPSIPCLLNLNFSKAVALGGREVSMPRTRTWPEERSSLFLLKITKFCLKLEIIVTSQDQK